MFIAHQIQISSYTAVAPLIKYSWRTIRQLDEVPLSAQLKYSSRIVILKGGSVTAAIWLPVTTPFWPSF